MCTLPNLQIHELEELTQRASKGRKKTKPNAIKTIVLDRQLLENTI
jgi:hypothetical protein